MANKKYISTTVVPLGKGKQIKNKEGNCKPNFYITKYEKNR
jgi:hypothetical protein